MLDRKCPLPLLINDLDNLIECSYHQRKAISNCNCSLQNVQLLENWLCKNHKIESKHNNNNFARGSNLAEYNSERVLNCFSGIRRILGPSKLIWIHNKEHTMTRTNTTDP